MDNIESPVFSRDVIEFVTVANEFCKFLEASEQLSLTEFVDKSHRLLPLLYLKGTLLPKIDEPHEEFNEKYVKEEDYTFIHDILISKFGNYNLYEEVFDPLRQENDEPAHLSLAENFADIYQDLKDFIMQFRMGTNEIMQNAIWECCQAFEQYWGQRTVNALRVLHKLRYVIVNLENEGETKLKNKDEFDYKGVDTSNWLISKRQEEYDDEG